MVHAQNDGAESIEAAANRANIQEAENPQGLSGTAATGCLAYSSKRPLERSRRPASLAADSEPEISGDSGEEAGKELSKHHMLPEKAKKKLSRRKRPRLVPPHTRTSRFRGVYWEPKGSKWYSSISSNHKQIHLGSFSTEEEAAQAFDREAIRLRGRNTFTNFPRKQYGSGHLASDSDDQNLSQAHQPSLASRRKLVPKKEADMNPTPVQEKDDSAATALLSLGSGIPPQAEPLVGAPRRIISAPVTLRAQKRKRAGAMAKVKPRLDGIGRARSKYTGVYQQSRGSGWFASICVDKSMRYLGTFAREEEAARAFDQEAIRLRGTGIELNLPHEAEAFMKRLKEEEAEAAANGKAPPCRKGPRPLVSAGPDFEARSASLNQNFQYRSSMPGESLESEMPASPQSPDERPKENVRSRRVSRRPSRQLRDFVRIDAEGASAFAEDSGEFRNAVDEADTTSGSDECELPSWRNKKLRSEPNPKESNIVEASVKSEEMQTPHIIRPIPTSQHASPRRSLGVTSSMAPAGQVHGSYLSLIAPGISTASTQLPSLYQQDGIGALRGFNMQPESSLPNFSNHNADGAYSFYPPNQSSAPRPMPYVQKPFLLASPQLPGFANPTASPYPGDSSSQFHQLAVPNSSTQVPAFLRPHTGLYQSLGGGSNQPAQIHSNLVQSYQQCLNNPRPVLQSDLWPLPDLARPIIQNLPGWPSSAGAQAPNTGLTSPSLSMPGHVQAGPGPGLGPGQAMPRAASATVSQPSGMRDTGLVSMPMSAQHPSQPGSSAAKQEGFQSFRSGLPPGLSTLAPQAGMCSADLSTLKGLISAPPTGLGMQLPPHHGSLNPLQMPASSLPGNQHQTKQGLDPRTAWIASTSWYLDGSMSQPDSHLSTGRTAEDPLPQLTSTSMPAASEDGGVQPHRIANSDVETASQPLAERSVPESSKQQQVAVVREGCKDVTGGKSLPMQMTVLAASCSHAPAASCQQIQPGGGPIATGQSHQIMPQTLTNPDQCTSEEPRQEIPVNSTDTLNKLAEAGSTWMAASSQQVPAAVCSQSANPTSLPILNEIKL